MKTHQMAAKAGGAKGRLSMAVVAALCMAAAPSLSFADELVTNGSFERYTGRIGAGRNGYDGLFDTLSASLVLDGWKKDSKDGYVGLCTASDSEIWKKAENVKGDTVCFFQRNASLSQKIKVPKKGTYWVSFRYASRLNPDAYGNGRFYIEIDRKEVGHVDGGRVNVWIDDAKVGYVDCDASMVKFRRYAVRTQIDAGRHVFKLTHTLDNPVNPDNKPCSAIDDVSLAAVGGQSGKRR